jgi:hypothetical protein
MTMQQDLSPDEQWNLDTRMIEASRQGDTETVRTLLANGADVHAASDDALCGAAHNRHAETAQLLLAAGADVHAQADWPWLCATCDDAGTETVRVLVKHIFAPDSWRGKSRAEIERQAEVLYKKAKFVIFPPPTEPEYIRQVRMILTDEALRCWEQIRPAPPKLNISAAPAQPRPL